MIIKADKQGIQVLEQLCDLALKSGGIKNFLTIKAIIEEDLANRRAELE